MIHTALTIAGSDPSGGAGIQADLRTFASVGVEGMAVPVSLTAQNAKGVFGVFHVPVEFVALQLDYVMSDARTGAAKTGMLGTAATVVVVAAKLREHAITQLVVDPVMVSTSGTRLLDLDAIAVLKSDLLPLASLVTPNLSEAEILTGLAVSDLGGMERAARKLREMGVPNVLVKGGHLEGNATDVFFDGRDFLHLEARRIPTSGVRGTGCMLSAAITAHLAQGVPLIEAIRLGKEFVTRSIAERANG